MKLRVRPFPPLTTRALRRVASAGGRLVHAALALVALAVVASSARAQSQDKATISGVVTDVLTKAPVPNVAVQIIGTKFGVNTSDDGRYKITDVPYGEYQIRATRLGFSPGTLDNYSIRQATITNADIEVNQVALSLKAITTAAGSDPISGVKAPYSITKLDAEQMPAIGVSDVTSMLTGKIAGFQAIRTDGAPGSGASVQMRAVSSPFRMNAVLFVLDGVPMNTSTYVTTADLNGMDIESIEVIRGSAAAAIYGSQASGGVIAIATKRGNDIPLNHSQLDFRTYGGTEAFDPGTRPPQRKHHIYRVNDKFQWVDANNVVVPKNNRSIDPTMMQDNDYAQTWDPVEQAFQMNKSYQTQVGITQRSAVSNFAITYARGVTPGIIRESEGQTNNNVRVGLQHQLRDNMNVDFTVNHARTSIVPPVTNFAQLFAWDPDVNLLRPDKTTGTKYVAVPDSAALTQNPMYLQLVATNQTRRVRSEVSTAFQVTFTNWLSMSTLVGYDKSDMLVNTWVPPGLPDTDGDGVTRGDLAYSESNGDGLNAQATVTMKHDFGKLTARLNNSAVMRREAANAFTISANTYALAGSKTIASASTRASSSTSAKRRSNAYRGQLGLDYSGKYIGDFLVTHEGSSLYGPDTRWNNFFRAGGSWIMSSETWFPKSLSFLTLAKARYTYGTAGTPPSYGDAVDSMGVISTTLIWSRLGNSDLRSEKKAEHEAGIDLEFNNKFTAQLTYSRVNTSDAIIVTAAPDASGFETVNENAANTHASTYEATFEGNWITTRKFSWWSNIVLDKSTDGMDQLGRSCFADTPNYINRCPGSDLTDFWGNSLMTSASQLSPKRSVSASQWEVDNNGFLVPVGVGNHYWEGSTKGLWGTPITIDGVQYNWGQPQLAYNDATNDYTRKSFGSYASKLNWGISNRFRYGNTQMYFSIAGRIGGKVYDSYLQQLMFSQDDPIVDQTGVADSLKKPYIYYTQGWSNNNTGYLSQFYETGTYAKLREVQLSYTFDAKKWSFLDRFGASRLQAQLVGSDLFVFTGYRGQDPEGYTAVGGLTVPIDNFRYPITRKLRGSLNITF